MDETDLVAGQSWQRQISDALEQATAFCVFIGARGIVNWVDSEVEVALDRATGPDPIAFIPVRASDAVPFSDLPPFVRQIHGVTDPLTDPDALTALVMAATRAETPSQAQKFINRPFVGLQPMNEAEADLFFGRTVELDDLAEKVQRHPVTAVVADSGAGKSSLVRAGLVPAFRGGRLTEPDEPGAKGRVRISLVMRPGDDPVVGLQLAVDAATARLGVDYRERAALRDDVQIDDVEKAGFALACGHGPDQTDVLLVVDQFEELLTQTAPNDARAFIAFLMALAQQSRQRSIRVVLTVRNDYFNLIRRHDALFKVLSADDGAAQLRLKALSTQALAEIVMRPLAMAGHTDSDDQAALLAAIRSDISSRPGDLALVQIALEAAWERHTKSRETLAVAYRAVGGVRGALDTIAERVRDDLTEAEKASLPALLVRLVRLGDTGGATRRPVALADLDEARRNLAQKLAQPQQRRLLMTSETAAEISHEALFRQWPRLQDFLQSHSDPIRTLGRFSEQTAAWIASGQRWHALPNAADSNSFAALTKTQPSWPSVPEKRMLTRARTKRRAITVGLGLVLAATLATTISAVISQHSALVAAEHAKKLQASETQARLAAQQSQREAVKARQSAERNASGALAALAQIEATRTGGDPVAAVTLALASWPENEQSPKPQIRSVPQILSQITPKLMERPWASPPALAGARGLFSPTGSHLAIEVGGAVNLINAETGELLANQPLDPGSHDFDFSPDGHWFAATRAGDAAMLWDLRSGETRLPMGGEKPVVVTAFSADSRHLGLASLDGHVVLHDLEATKNIRQHMIVGLDVATHMAITPDGDRFVVHDRTGWLRIFDWSDGLLHLERSFDARVTDLKFSPDGAELWVTHLENGPAVASPGRMHGAAPSVMRHRLARLRAHDLSVVDETDRDHGRHGSDRSALWSMIEADRLHRIGHDQERMLSGALTHHFADQAEIVGADMTDGLLATVNRMNEIMLTQMDPIRTVGVWRQSGPKIVDVLLEQGSDLRIARADGSVERISTRKATAVFETVSGIADADFVHFAKNGKFFIRNRRGHLAVIRVRDGTVLWHPASAGLQPFTAMAVSNDGHAVAVLLHDGALSVRRSDGDSRKITPPGAGSDTGNQSFVVDRLVFSDDGSRLAAGGGFAMTSSLAVWDLDTGETLFHGAPAAGPLRGLSFFPNGYGLLAQWSDQAAYVLSPSLRGVPPYSVPVTGDTLTADRPVDVIAWDRAVAETADGLAVLDLQTQSVLARLPVHGLLDGGHAHTSWGVLLGFDPDNDEILTWHRRTRQIGRWRNVIPEGSAFQVICALLPADGVGVGMRRIAEDYSIDIHGEICQGDRAFPLPSWVPQAPAQNSGQTILPNSDAQKRAEIGRFAR